MALVRLEQVEDGSDSLVVLVVRLALDHGLLKSVVDLLAPVLGERLVKELGRSLSLQSELVRLVLGRSKLVSEVLVALLQSALSLRKVRGGRTSV